MILKSKAVVVDAVSAEKEIAFCSYDDNIRRKAERHAEICGEIATLALAGAGKIETGIYRERLIKLYSIKDSLETELNVKCTEFRDELHSRKFEVADIAGIIPEGSVLWEFIVYEPIDFQKPGSGGDRIGPPRYLAFTLDNKGRITLNDLGDATEIDNLISEARKAIYDARETVYSPLVEESEKRLTGVTGELYKRIFEPLTSSLGNNRYIFISPDGQLNLIPFEILPAPDGQYVVEKYEISYLSSGRELLKFKRKREPGNWALVMADPDFDLSGDRLTRRRERVLKQSGIFTVEYTPTRGASDCMNKLFPGLPYTQRESMSVVRTLEKNSGLRVESYYGGEVLEEVLKGMESAPRVLHLATHGYFCEDLSMVRGRTLENPLLRSGLALAGANRLMSTGGVTVDWGEDGILTAFEVSGLNLVGTELAVLSACETGVGEIKNGEGVYGLRRTFQYAGAETILMSLWKVPDRETYRLMSGFYKNWVGEGRRKREALRQSTLTLLNDLRKRYGTAHPLLWGGFILAGNPI
jgi:CHAT domain-containing protein